MKRPQWLTRRRVLVGCGAAIAIGAIVLGYRFKFTGFGADETVVKSEKTIERDKQGNVITEKTVTTTPQDGKKLWDWLSLLGVPFSLALLGAWLQHLQQRRVKEEQQQIDIQRGIEKQLAGNQLRQEKKTAEAIAAENRREESLQTYFDRVSTLLVEKNLLAIAAKVGKTSEPEPGQENTDEQKEALEQKELLDISVDIIRARTLSILRRLENDAERKTSVIRFLLEAEVISKLGLNLSDANLSHANLSGANLNYANLSHANLSGANLNYANLSHANLSHAYLNQALLNQANLSKANLSGGRLLHAILSGTNLNYANLSDANLSRAEFYGARLNGANLGGTNLSKANLSRANLSGAILKDIDLRDTIGLKQEQLEGENAPLLCNTALPKGIGVNPNRDCDPIEQLWRKRHRKIYKTLEKAQAIIGESWQKD